MFDRAVWYFGVSVEADMDEASDAMPDAKAAMKTHVRQRVLDKYLNPDQRPAKGRFRDPARSV